MMSASIPQYDKDGNEIDNTPVEKREVSGKDFAAMMTGHKKFKTFKK